MPTPITPQSLKFWFEGIGEKNFVIVQRDSDPDETELASLPAGYTWFNKATNKLMSWNGTSSNRVGQPGLVQSPVIGPNEYRGPAHGLGGTMQFYGAVLDMTGRAIMIPYKAANIGIYNPATHAFSLGAAHGKGADAFLGGCRHGKYVVFAPANSPEVGRYDSGTEAFTVTAAHGAGVGYAYYNGTAVGDEVIFAPGGSATIGRYNPETNVFTAGVATGFGLNAYAYSSCCTMQDGRVFLCPGLSPTIQIYDPVSNTIEVGPAHNQPLSAFAFAGCVTLPNGKILMIPHGSASNKMYRFFLYNPETGKVETGPLHGETPNSPFWGGVLLSTGKVLCLSFGAAYSVLYDWQSDTVSRAFAPPIAQAWNGGCLTPSGRVVLAPLNHSRVNIYDTVAEVPRTVALDPVNAGGSY